MLTKNVCGVDRVLRIVLGLALILVGLLVVGATGGIVMAVAGGILVVTGLAGFCPLWVLLGISTCSTSE